MGTARPATICPGTPAGASPGVTVAAIGGAIFPVAAIGVPMAVITAAVVIVVVVGIPPSTVVIVLGITSIIVVVPIAIVVVTPVAIVVVPVTPIGVTAVMSAPQQYARHAEQCRPGDREHNTSKPVHNASLASSASYSILGPEG